ncbi:unnamed protein product [Hermetia illucens]|uniref:Uncharacterized protein n=1 Tax=Hermetia illucens TaxID=343691 RepID=A0A7R8YNK2_HERIL|nr:unnamed protein product [Hermetia illucens]
MKYEQMTPDQIKIAKLEQTLIEVMTELRAARALNEKLSALIDNLNKRLEKKENPVKTENNKRIRLESPSTSEDGNDSPAEEERKKTKRLTTFRCYQLRNQWCSCHRPPNQQQRYR